ncbi:ABC transporter ATP-binding protein [Wenjunlia tyrosinilytica]|jgi:branched-chain amino acid transport system ATP-binding protein|uniref:ABC transporter ATP-binding protein n=1 Tax=Wenjunlia tyrosinilytica TaxID=1544741 RepID=A0A917ZWB3_9ACTN|nr:ATP-binding cassette domain-containing protein [Wenjunlia tyrosinilytica]GGO95255.1 ABC transporter ATP-binding protein [Wenjunlia tyrosinilytica]
MSVEIELRGARVRYGPLEALHGVDLAMPSGRLTVLLGRNGSGRSTALHALAGIVPLSGGRVLWRGEDVTGLDAFRRARRGLALVPEQRAVFGSLTVEEHFALVTGDVGGRTPAFEAFPALRGLLKRRVGTLSGGEQRMVAVSLALLSGAGVLLLDEPGQGLAPAAAARMHQVLAEQAADGGRTVVVAEQQLRGALRGAAVVHVLRRGSVAFTGEPAEPGFTRRTRW